MKLHRWVVASLASAGLLCGAAPALADGPATTLSAQYVTSSTALLRGTVDAGSEPITWSFRFGPGTTYNQTTATETVPAGSGPVTVSALISGLNPRSHYQFQLVTQHGQATMADPLVLNYGSQRSLLTRPGGEFGIGPTTVSFANRYAPVSLYCAGSRTCGGYISITRPLSRSREIVFGARYIRLGAGRFHTYQVRMTAAGLRVLRRGGGEATARLTVEPDVGEVTLTRQITLLH